MNDRDIVEDSPRMQSVALHSPSPIRLPRAAPLAKAPPQRIALSEGSNKIAPTSQQQGDLWKVETLKALPIAYLVERTNVYVPDATPQEVASRVADCLRQESIAATYNNSEALVEAETKEHVQFAVRLWSDKDQVLVEIQRTAGCCFLFHQSAKAVLRAAKGLRKQQPQISFTIPDCVPQETEEESKQCTQEGLEIALDLLKKDRLDAHMLAIESLVYLTKATKNRSFAAHCILCGEFRSTILCLVESFRMHKSTSVALSQMEEEHLTIMHRNALTVLANCLVALEHSGELLHVLGQQEEFRSNTLLATLVDEVGSAEQRPHDACQAARCLQSLFRASDDTKQQLFDGPGGSSKVWRMPRQ